MTSEERQEKFAEENYAGLDETGQAMLDKLEIIKEYWNIYASEKNRESEKAEKAYRQMEEVGKTLENDYTILSIKLSNVVGHALNSSSTKMIRKVIKFLDKHSLNDKMIHYGLMKIASARTSDGSLMEMAMTVAARKDDVKFASELMSFIEKNKGRENIWEFPGIPWDLRNAGDMVNFTRTISKERIALDALVSGSKHMYQFLVGSEGLNKDTIVNYIKQPYSAFTIKEARNVIALEPWTVEKFLEYAPDRVPPEVSDIFIF